MTNKNPEIATSTAADAGVFLRLERCEDRSGYPPKGSRFLLIPAILVEEEWLSQVI